MKKIEKLNLEIKAVKLWLKTFNDESLCDELQKDYMLKKLSKLRDEQDRCILKWEYNKLMKQAEAIKIKLSNI
jgi:hypothetical protein